jgi:hypothetical protein
MEPSDRIIATLSAEDSPLRRAGAVLVVDHVLDTPVGQLVDVESLLPIIVEALTRDNVDRAVQRHVIPGIARVREQLADAGETVGDSVPEDVRVRIIELAGKPDGPRFAWMRGALDPSRLRELIAPVLQDTLMQFARNLPVVGGGGGRDGERGGAGGGLVGRLGREVQKSTGRLVNVGKSMAGGLGVDLEARFQDAAREFSQGAVGGLQRAMRERLQSEQGRRILGALSHSVVDHIMATPVEKILRDLDRLPLEDAVGLAPAIIAHDMGRELIREIIAGEVRASRRVWAAAFRARARGGARLRDLARSLRVRGLRPLAERRAFGFLRLACGSRVGP